MNARPEPVIYDLDSFIAPRERMLTDGTLTEFAEWEIAERTEIAGSVAHRFSHYSKSGFHDGERFEGAQDHPVRAHACRLEDQRDGLGRPSAVAETRFGEAPDACQDSPVASAGCRGASQLDH